MPRNVAQRARAFAASSILACLLGTAAPAVADDRTICQSGTAEAVPACTRLIGQGRSRGRDLGALHASRANAYYATGQRELARADLDRAVALDPRNDFALHGRANILADAGLHEQALADFTAAIRVQKTFVYVFNRGLTLMTLRRHDEAIGDFTEALRLKPDLAAAYKERGVAHYRKRDYAPSIRDFDQAVRLDPRFATAFNERGVSRYLTGDLGGALSDFTAAVTVGRPTAASLGNRGRTYLQLGEPDKALLDLNEALRLDPRSVGALFGRAQALERRSDLPGAAADYRSAVALDPSDLFAQQGLERVQRLSGPPPKRSEPAPAGSPERRVALVIGNSAYPGKSRLPNPVNDARAIAARLRELGFGSIALETDVPLTRLRAALASFSEEASRADWAVIYFAGHGAELGGTNFLVPIDASFNTDREFAGQAARLDEVLAVVAGARKIGLVVLDACRNNPFREGMVSTMASTAFPSQGLAPVAPQGATLVAFSAKHGQEAQDGEGTASPFAQALLDNLGTRGLEISLLFRKVRDEVMRATNRGQEPFTYGSLPGQSLYFRDP